MCVTVVKMKFSFWLKTLHTVHASQIPNPRIFSHHIAYTAYTKSIFIIIIEPNNNIFNNTLDMKWNKFIIKIFKVQLDCVFLFSYVSAARFHLKVFTLS